MVTDKLWFFLAIQPKIVAMAGLQGTDGCRPEKIIRDRPIALTHLILSYGALSSFLHEGGMGFPDARDYFTLAENLVKISPVYVGGVAPTASRHRVLFFWLALWKCVGTGSEGDRLVKFCVCRSRFFLGLPGALQTFPTPKAEPDTSVSPAFMTVICVASPV
jgi:hypothetical protein